MKNKSFDWYNNILGWVVFAIALITYTLTLEPSVSFWDCGEYISSAVKLEVPHSPGASTFQIIGAAFASFAFGNTEKLAWVINFLSGLSSAFTILFTFWIVSHYAKKITTHYNNFSPLKVFGAATLASLSFCFSDSFWFSAVEGEVYAMASCVTALIIWLAIKWENDDSPRANRWLILISLMLGFSAGVHVLSLLTIPAICAIYISKKYPLNDVKQFVLYNIIAVVVFGLIFKILLPGIMLFFGKSEIFFINSVGLPFHFGTAIAVVIVFSTFIYLVKYSKQKNHLNLYQASLSVIFILIGFSTWIMLALRANANTPINLNNPSTAVTLLDYFNREQYGEWPVLYGPYYTAYEGGIKLDENEPYDRSGIIYEKDDESGKYIEIDRKISYNFDKNYVGFFPRMYHPSPDVHQNYKNIAGEPTTGLNPSFGQNLTYFLRYQVGYMYLRYLMWNFSGRQNDYQGKLEPHKGNWKTGITPLDKTLGLDTSILPDYLKNNKANNEYFMLPFLLGILGIFYLSMKDIKVLWITGLVFLLTGIGIILYTNVRPFEPRERDYAVVGSFWIFAMWIGFGLLFIVDLLEDFIKNKLVKSISILLIAIGIPSLMAFQNWDDHDRSGRYIARDMSKNYINSCDPNSVLIVYGDNDTYPLWYMQETEEYRTDVKILNWELLATDWHIDQAKRATYNAAPTPGQLVHKQYRQGTRDVVYSMEREERINLKDLVDFIAVENSDQNTFEDGGEKNYFMPTQKFYIPVNKENALEAGIISEKDLDMVPDSIAIDYKKRVLYKKDLFMLDFLANFDWKRPLYFGVAGGGDPAAFGFLQDYLKLEGVVYKLMPYKTAKNSYEFGSVDSKKMYSNFMDVYTFGNFKEPSIYKEETARRSTMPYMLFMPRLVETLIEENQKGKAEKVLDKMVQEFPISIEPLGTGHLEIAEYYLKLGKNKKALSLLETIKANLDKELLYYTTLSEYSKSWAMSDIYMNIQQYMQLMRLYDNFKLEGMKNLEDTFELYLTKLPEIEQILQSQLNQMMQMEPSE